jgi:hypothetical protein
MPRYPPNGIRLQPRFVAAHRKLTDMLLGVIADDFTGASDIANTLAKGLPGQGGLRTAQFLGLPTGRASDDIEAGVVALKSRSIPAADAVRQSLAALDWLLEQGCRQIVFKYCSTFDSTPEGNIGPVGERSPRGSASRAWSPARPSRRSDARCIRGTCSSSTGS